MSSTMRTRAVYFMPAICSDIAGSFGFETPVGLAASKVIAPFFMTFLIEVWDPSMMQTAFPFSVTTSAST